MSYNKTNLAMCWLVSHMHLVNRPSCTNIGERVFASLHLQKTNLVQGITNLAGVAMHDCVYYLRVTIICRYIFFVNLD